MFSPDDIEALRGDQDQIEAFPVATERNAPGTALARRDTARLHGRGVGSTVGRSTLTSPSCACGAEGFAESERSGGIQRNA